MIRRDRGWFGEKRMCDFFRGEVADLAQSHGYLCLR